MKTTLSSNECFVNKVPKDQNYDEINNKFMVDLNKSNSINSKINSTDVLKIYQDVSADDMKTSFRNGREVIKNNLEL